MYVVHVHMLCVYTCTCTPNVPNENLITCVHVPGTLGIDRNLANLADQNFDSNSSIFLLPDIDINIDIIYYTNIILIHV